MGKLMFMLLNPKTKVAIINKAKLNCKFNEMLIVLKLKYIFILNT